MVYFTVGVIVLVAVVLSIQKTFEAKKKGLLEMIRQTWGKPKDEYFPFELVSLHPMTPTDSLINYQSKLFMILTSSDCSPLLTERTARLANRYFSRN